MKIKFLGGVGTVTGSQVALEHQGFKLLVDCGLFQGPKDLRELNRQPIENAADYGAVILTHAHIDHSGRLPALVRQGFANKIHSTAASLELCKILLFDSAKLQQEDADFANRTKHSRHFPAEPIYNEYDVAETLQRFRTHVYNQWHPLNSDISFRFLRSGHILGAALVQIQYISEGQTRLMTFTGDIGGGRSLVIKEPENIIETDYLISESTYGDRSLKPLNEDDFASLINRVYQRHGTLIIPAFSVGRTQELLYLIKKLQEENKISKGIPIYLDSPMATKASTIYTQFPDELKLSFKNPIAETFFHPVNFRVTETTDESMLLCMSDQPKIVLSASGMLQGGRVLHHLSAKLGDEKNAVLFVGYQGRGTKGLLLKNGLRRIRIHHREVDVEAEIVTLDSLSAHADSDELMKWYKNIVKSPRQTFLVHGEPDSSEALCYRVKNELSWPCLVAENQKVYDLK